MQMFSNKIQNDILVLFLINCCYEKYCFILKKTFTFTASNNINYEK